MLLSISDSELLRESWVLQITITVKYRTQDREMCIDPGPQNTSLFAYYLSELKWSKSLIDYF